MTNLTSEFQATWLVAQREITAQLRSKSFVISTAILVGGVLIFILVLGWLGNRDSDSSDGVRVGVLADSGAAALLENFQVTQYDSVPDAEADLTAGELDALVLPATLHPATLDEAPGPADQVLSSWEVVGVSDVPSEVVSALSLDPQVRLLEANPDTDDEGMQIFITMIFGLVFMMAAITFGSTIAQNTVVEKQTRTVEILLAAVPARVLFAGKVLGHSVLALGQVALIAAAAILGLTVSGQTELLTALGAPITWFIVFFILGFVLLAVIYAALAALVTRIEDTGGILTPVTFLTMSPYFIGIFFVSNPTVITWTSYFPVAAPVLMPVRLFMGTAAWWEPLVALAILVLTTVALINVGARVYQRSVLQTSRRVSLKEALTGAQQ